MGARVGNYELDQEYFSSPPSTFFTARNTILGNPVIVRRLTLDPARAEDARATFYREMRFAASLSHPHILRPIDVLDADGYVYAVLEREPGTRSEEIVREKGPMSVAEAATWGSQIADALAHMHSRGHVSGRVSPAFVMVDDRGARLVSLTKAADLAAGIWPLRRAVAAIGPFTAPEEIRGARPTAESDVYSLAATVWWWLTGAHPQGGTTPVEALARAGERPAPLRIVRPDVPEQMARALEGALHPDPAERRGSAASVGTVLDEVHRRLAAEIPSGFAPGARLHPDGTAAEIELQGRHGSGAYGVVFRARAIADGQVLAVKALKPEHREDHNARERFLREARALQGIDDRNVVHMRAVGEERGTPFAVMEFIEGPDLATLLLREGTLAPPRAVLIAAGISRGLEAIHAEGIVHRDLKPHNILLAPGDRPVIADFGVAKLSAAPRMTMTGMVVGTPAYMAPETFTEEAPTFSVDLYAVGAILYELLTGAPPFRSPDALATIREIRDVSAPALPADFPDELRRVVARLLEKSPAARHASAAELAADLEALACRLDATCCHEPVYADCMRPAGASRTTDAGGSRTTP